MWVMHTYGYTHRDLKLANILVDFNGNLLIADLGMISNKDLMESMDVGSLKYKAPELIEMELYGKNRIEVYDSKVDVWSIGLIIWELVFKKFIVPQSKHSYIKDILGFKIEEKIDEFSKEFPGMISHDLQKILIDCLQHDTTKRKSLEEIYKQKYVHSDDILPSFPFQDVYFLFDQLDLSFELVESNLIILEYKELYEDRGKIFPLARNVLNSFNEFSDQKSEEIIQKLKQSWVIGECAYLQYILKENLNALNLFSKSLSIIVECDIYKNIPNSQSK